MDEKIEYLIRYFELHAGQRMSTFNFFIILSGLLVFALVKTFESEFQYPEASILVSFCIMMVAGIFWKLDGRVKFLIKHAEGELILLERGIGYPSLFSSEEMKTEEAERQCRPCFICAHLTYSKCFNAIYALFFAIGLVGSLAGISVIL